MIATQQAPGMKLTHRQIQVVFIGLMAGMLLASLDQTIVATAHKVYGTSANDPTRLPTRRAGP